MTNKEIATIDEQKKEVQVASSLPVDGFIQMIERLAENPNVDIQKMKEIVGLQERVLDRNAKAEFDSDFIRMKPRLPLVIKTHKNDQTKSKYAKLENINQVIDPILGEFGFGISAKTIEQNENGLTIRTFLRHRGGHIEFTDTFMPIDDVGMSGSKNKTKPHGLSSARMYARRVGLCELLNISTGDDNDGNYTPDNEKIMPEKAEELEALLAAAGGSVAKFKDYMKVEEFTDIKRRDLSKAMTLISEIKEARDQREKEKKGAKA